MAAEKVNGANLTSEELAEIHIALERSRGSIAQAARDLGVEDDKLKETIKGNTALRLRWWGGDEDKPTPDGLDSMLREAPMTRDHERLAQLVKRDSDKLKEGIHLLPLTDSEKEKALALQQFGRDNFTSQLSIVNASITATIVKMMTFMEETGVRIKTVRAAINSMGMEQDENRGFFCEEENNLSDRYLRTGELMRNIMKESFQGNKTLAMMKFKQKQQTSMKSAKPGYQDIGANIEVET